MKLVTLCFLLDRENKKILLAMKKRGFGEGKWAGVGGKVDIDAKETVEDAMLREAYEEIGVEIRNYSKVALIDFVFKHNGDFNQRVHVFIANEWVEEPKETEEMKPQWYSFKEIPYTKMWEDNKHWLSKVLKGQRLIARFVFGEEEKLLKKEIKKIRDGEEFEIERLY